MTTPRRTPDDHAAPGGPAGERRPLRVVMVITYYHPHWTGLTAYAKRLAEGLAARGHEVTVLAARHDRRLARAETLAGVRVVRVAASRRISRGVVMLGLPRALARALAGADVVQMHTPLLEAPLVTAMARRRGVASVVTHHGDLVMGAGVFDRVVERLATALMVAALRRATRVTVHSRDYADHSAFLAHAAGKLDCIYPPAVIPRPAAGAAAALRAELGLGDAPVAGFAGRWVEEKGFDVLLRAVPPVARELPACRFVYAGAAPAYERFRERCAPLLLAAGERVVELGLITDQARLAAFYAMCDAFVLSSRTDCFPSTQLEAILCGTPLVTADTPGAREVVRRTGMGVIVRREDPEALARGIIDVVRDRGRFVRPPAEVRAVFDAERSVAAYEALLRRLAGGGGA